MGNTTSSSAGGYVYGGGVSQPYNAIRGGYVQGGDCGCAGFVGGAEGDASIKSIAGYSDSAARRAKDEIVRAVLKTVGEMFGESFPSDPDAALKMLMAKLPNPKKKPGTFRQDAEVQKKICEGLAKGFNQYLTPGRKGHKALIDTDGSPEYVCRAVSELVDGLASGMKTEFLNTQAELRRLIRNMKILITLAQQEGDAVEAVVDASGDSGLRRDAEVGIGRGAKALAALGHQLEVLSRLLNTTVADAEKEMELALLEKDESISDVLKGMGMEPGSKLLSDNIAGTLVGVATVASMAKDLNAALDKVGMGVGAFFDAASFADVEKAADAASARAPEKVGEILSAKETLKKQFGLRGRKGLRQRMGGADDNVDFDATGGDDIADLASAESAAGQFAMGGDDIADLASAEDAAGQFAMGGGDDDDPAVTRMEKQLKKQRMERVLIVREFTKKLHRAYGRILEAVKAAAPQIGKSVPAGAALEEFVTALDGISGDSTKYIELSLVGFYPDSARASSLRAQYLSSLDRLSSAAAGLGAAPGIEEIRSAIEEIQKTVAFYGEVMAKRSTGAGEAAAVGGGLEEKDLDKMFPVLNSTTHSISEAKRLLRYHGFLASVQGNLKQAAEEIESYGENYSELLGDAVAERLETDGLGYEKLREYLKKYKPGNKDSDKVLTAEDARAPLFQDYLHRKNADPTNSGDAEGRKFYQELKDVALDRIAQTQKAKGDMYRAAQAVDLALQSFTRDALHAPESLVRSVRSSLEDTKVIARWYSDNTGDSMAAAFEGLRRRIIVGNGGILGKKSSGAEDGIDTDSVGSGSGHYYGRVYSAYSTGTTTNQVMIGDHFGVQLASEGDLRRAQNAVDNSFKDMQALKNLVNVFVRMGSPAKMFMKPAALYNVILNYLKVSSFRVPSVVLPLGTAWKSAEAGDVSAEGQSAIRRLMHFTFAPVFRGTVPDDDLECMGFDDTNTLFFTMVKAMCAKVMSILNLYDMLEKPSKLGGIAPIRMILGGSEAKTGGAVPEVIPGAAGLYFHLPRLAEFYVDLFLRRHNASGAGAPPLADDLFGAGGNPPWAGANNTSRLILLVPDAAGTFSGLIKLYFSKFRRDSAGPLQGTYGVGEASDVIAEINKIYSHYSSRGSPDAILRAACLGFAAEINRRYGVVTKSQWEKMDELYRDAFESEDLARIDATGRGPATNYAILPGEDDDLVDGAPGGAPSDGFLLDPAGRGRTVDGRPLRARKHKFHMGPADWDMLRDLRDAVTNYFAGDDGFAGTSVYSDVISMKGTELARAGDSEKKFSLAIDLLNQQSSQNVTGGAAWMEKLVFHEMVLAPLSVLHRIAQFISWYRGAVWRLKTDSGGNQITSAGATQFKQLINLILTLNSVGDLVTATVGRSSSASVMVDFGPLKKLVEEMVAHLRSTLPKWRAKLKKGYYDEIVGVVAVGNRSYPVGSLGWYDDYLIGKVLRGQRQIEGGVPTVPKDSLQKVQEVLTERAELIFKWANEVTNLGSVQEALQSFGYALHKSNLLFHTPDDISDQLGSLMRGDQVMDSGRLRSGGSYGGKRDPTVWKMARSGAQRSIFMGFNRALIQMVRAGFDQPTSKIYAGLVRELATSTPLAAATNKPFGEPSAAAPNRPSTPPKAPPGFYDDLGPPAAVNAKTNSAGADIVLTRGVAIMMKRLATDRTRDGASIHLAESLADVSESAKTRMKAVLPVLAKRMDQIQNAARVLEQVISRQMAGVKIHFVKENLTAIQDACSAAKKAMVRTLGELGDRPSFMEVSPGFAESYSSRYGKAPLIPASFGLTPFQTSRLDVSHGMNTDSLDGSDLALAYGVRGLYAGRSGFSGAGAFLEKYKGPGAPSSSETSQLLGQYGQFFHLADGLLAAKNVFARGDYMDYPNLVGVLVPSQLPPPVGVANAGKIFLAGSGLSVDGFPLYERADKNVTTLVESESQRASVATMLKGQANVEFTNDTLDERKSLIQMLGPESSAAKYAKAVRDVMVTKLTSGGAHSLSTNPALNDIYSIKRGAGVAEFAPGGLLAFLNLRSGNDRADARTNALNNAAYDFVTLMGVASVPFDAEEIIGAVFDSLTGDLPDAPPTSEMNVRDADLRDIHSHLGAFPDLTNVNAFADREALVNYIQGQGQGRLIDVEDAIDGWDNTGDVMAQRMAAGAADALQQIREEMEKRGGTIRSAATALKGKGNPFIDGLDEAHWVEIDAGLGSLGAASTAASVVDALGTDTTVNASELPFIGGLMKVVGKQMADEIDLGIGQRTWDQMEVPFGRGHATAKDLHGHATKMIKLLERKKDDFPAITQIEVQGGDLRRGEGYDPGNLLKKSEAANGRQREVRASIIDLNIVPVNVHALQRGIPFASLYNYAYTFEEMAAAALGTSRPAVQAHLRELSNGGGGRTSVATTRDGFLSLLFHPQQIVGYTGRGELGDKVLEADGGAGIGGGDRTRLVERARRFFGEINTVEGGFMFRIARGEDDLRMGRPKFISEELFGKVLLGNVWPAGRGQVETDPVAGPYARGANSDVTPPPYTVTTELTYQDMEDEGAYRGTVGPNVTRLILNSAGDRTELFKIGRSRFDTSFVRTAYFSAAIQRMMGYQLRRALVEDRRVIRPTHGLVAPQMTEFAVGETFDEARDFDA